MQKEEPIPKLILATLFFVSTLASAQALQPERKVQGNTIVSERDPAMRITLPQDAHYVGGDRFILHSAEDCEMHVFVKADARKHVLELYRVQFSNSLPGQGQRHQYDAKNFRKFDGENTYIQTGLGPAGAPPAGDADTERHLQKLLADNGYTLHPEMRYVLLTRPLGALGRKEMTIVYAEDLTPTGLTAKSLRPGGKAASRWPAMQKELVERADKKIQLESLAREKN